MVRVHRSILFYIVTEKSGNFCGTMPQNSTSEPKTAIVTEKSLGFSVTVIISHIRDVTVSVLSQPS